MECTDVLYDFTRSSLICSYFVKLYCENVCFLRWSSDYNAILILFISAYLESIDTTDDNF